MSLRDKRQGGAPSHSTSMTRQSSDIESNTTTYRPCRLNHVEMNPGCSYETPARSYKYTVACSERRKRQKSPDPKPVVIEISVVFKLTVSRGIEHPLLYVESICEYLKECGYSETKQIEYLRLQHGMHMKLELVSNARSMQKERLCREMFRSLEDSKKSATT